MRLSGLIAIVAMVCAVAGCDGDEACELVANTYDIVELELPDRVGGAQWAVLDIDGNGDATNPIGTFLFPLLAQISSSLPSNADRVAALVRERRFLWRLSVESCARDGAPQTIELVSFDDGEELSRLSPAVVTEPASYLAMPIARDGRGHVPLGLFFDGSESPEAGWLDIPGLAVSPEYPAGPLSRTLMTGRLGFGLTDDDVVEFVLPALARTATRLLAEEPSGGASWGDSDMDGQISVDEVEFLLDMFEPDLDLFTGTGERRVYSRSVDGRKESNSFSFRFRATRICGGDQFSCQDR
jgi:hypothetical protein